MVKKAVKAAKDNDLTEIELDLGIAEYDNDIIIYGSSLNRIKITIGEKNE